MGSLQAKVFTTKTGVKLRCVKDNGTAPDRPAIGLPMWVHGDEALGGWRYGKRIMVRKNQRRYGVWLMGPT